MIEDLMTVDIISEVQNILLMCLEPHMYAYKYACPLLHCIYCLLGFMNLPIYMVYRNKTLSQVSTSDRIHKSKMDNSLLLCFEMSFRNVSFFFRKTDGAVVSLDVEKNVFSQVLAIINLIL